MKPKLYFAVILATGYFTFSPFLASGAPAGHLSAPQGRGNEAARFIHPFWALSYFGLAGVYDSDYSYAPTPEQQAYAEQQVKKYLVTARKHQTHPAPHRYISVETLRPTKGQLADYTKRVRQPFSSGPSHLRCLMVFDTQTKQFVGPGATLLLVNPWSERLTDSRQQARNLSVKGLYNDYATQSHQFRHDDWRYFQ